MKNILVLLFLTFSLLTNAQTEQTHIPASKSIVGIWRQTGIENRNTGEIIDIISGNYKVINADGTFFTFVTWGINDPSKDTVIGQYGTYEITSDNTLVEHIIKHIINPNLNGTDGDIKFKQIDENTIIISWCSDNKIRIHEKWTRLPLSM